MSNHRPPAIRVQHLSHSYGPTPVLHNLNFQVEQGEIFGFIGPNGAGKTTTIRVLATLLEPSYGRVEICGIDLNQDAETARKHIGYMADHAGVYDRLTVQEYLEFFAAAYHVQDPNVVSNVVQLSDIGQLRGNLVMSLSKGQKQRLQLARALVHDPDVLILDEPASDLDPRARIEIRNLLLDLRSLGKTIFLSSHILSELDDLCTSVGIIEAGRMVVCGAVDQLASLLQNRANQGPTMATSKAPLDAAETQAQGGTEGAAAKVQTSREVRIRVLARGAAAEAVLANDEHVAEVLRHELTLQLLVRGGDEEVAAVVAGLVQHGFGVVEVDSNSNRLEQIFLSATARQPQHGSTVAKP
jgi:ABC-2 type transport system ATP-binding protein